MAGAAHADRNAHMTKKSLQDLRREVSDLTDGIRRELKEHVSEIRDNLDRQVNRLRAEVEDIKEELERRFGSDDSHVVFRALPQPRRLDMPLTEVLERRQTRRTFSDEPISDLDMATILWAADGINRSNGRRTTPTALDWRETDIYLLKSNGIWRWVPEKNGLLFCDLADLRSETFFAAPHLKVAPVHIVYVSSRPRTETLISRLGEGVLEKLKHSAWTPEKLEEMRTRSMIIDVGAKIQAVYMAAAAMDLSCVARTGFDARHVERILRLKKGESVVAIQTLGYRPNSLLDTIR